MTLKVGDRVRRTEADDTDLPKGFETTVAEVCDGGFFRHYDAGGDLRYRHYEEYHLIADGPVRTVTRTVTEIVPGNYATVGVTKGPKGTVTVSIPPFHHDAAMLRAAAAVLFELAGALEE